MPRLFGWGTFGSGTFGDPADHPVIDRELLLVDRDAASSAFAAAPSESHTRATLIEVLNTGSAIAQLVDPAEGESVVTDGTVSIDAGQAIRGTLDLSIVDDGSLGLVPVEAGDLLTPYGNEIRVWMGFAFAETIELVSQGVFLIDDSDVTDTGDELMIEVNGLDRAKRIVDAKFEDDGSIGSGSIPENALQLLIAEAYPDAEFDFTETSITLPAVTWQAGDDRWDFCQGIATAIGAELYLDESGVFVLRPVPSAAGDPFRTIEEGAGGVLLRAGKHWTREDTYNKVIVPVEGPSGELFRGEALDDNPDSPTYYYGAFGKKPYRYPDSRFITTEAQANDAAAGILQSLLGIGQQIEFDTIVDPALFPSDVIQVSRERAGISAEVHVLDSVSKPLAIEGDMNGQTRRTVDFS